MAAKRLSMRKLKEVLRLAALGHSDRVIAHSLDIGRSTVRRYRSGPSKRRVSDLGTGMCRRWSTTCRGGRVRFAGQAGTFCQN